MPKVIRSKLEGMTGHHWATCCLETRCRQPESQAAVVGALGLVPRDVGRGDTVTRAACPAVPQGWLVGWLVEKSWSWCQKVSNSPF